MNISKKKYLLILGDIAILYLSLWLTLAVRYFDLGLDSWVTHFWPFTAVFFFWIIIFYIDDLYDLNYGRDQIDLISRLLRGTAVNAFFAVAFFYIAGSRFFSIRPQRVLLINLVIAAILLYVWRVAFNYFLRNRQTIENVLLIGNTPASREIIGEIKNNPALGFRVRALINVDGQQTLPENIEVLSDYQNLSEICRRHKIKTIVTAVNTKEFPELLENLFSCLPLQVNFYEVAAFYEKITGKIPVASIEQSWFLENLSRTKSNLYHNTKRMIDVAISSAILIIFLPFLPLIALAVKLSSPGPVLFKQKRVGENAKEFTVVKFRSMVANAENNGAQWASKDDPRVTKLGKLMRKTRIDEIPQLVNIVKGEMSLIGPRPERPEFVKQLQSQIPFYKERLLVKPGLTGWAQVMGPNYGGSKEETMEKIQYDLYYIKNQSLGLDLSIVLKTVKTILTRKGQ